METETACNVGLEEVPPPPKTGVDRPEPRLPNPGREAGGIEGTPGKLEDMFRVTSKSVPFDPRPFCTCKDTGSWTFAFAHDLTSVGEGNKLTSYPANTNFPSGGTKLRSPGRSFHLANLTHGWKTGNSIVLSRPNFPPAVERVRSTSGTPDILELQTMEPLAKADNGLPDGAKMTDSCSTMSMYNSLLVWRTFAFRQGIAGPSLGSFRAGCCRAD